MTINKNKMTLSDTKKINPNAIIIHSGILFDVFNPKMEDINIIDGAHGLSNLCRFGGHSPKFYSVAQHSVLCSLEEGTPQEQLDCLCHDLTEYVLIDLPAPIKRQIIEYVRIEDNLQKIICKRFNLTFPLSKNTHRVDKLIFKFEYESFFEKFDKKFDFWSPEKAKEKFLSRFYELTEKILIGK
jgi:hypothetical protein